jgi:hypothetical protein
LLIILKEIKMIQVDGLHPDHFENSRVHDIASNSSSLERELAPAALAHAGVSAVVTEGVHADGIDMTDSVVRVGDADTPEDTAVFLGDTYTDVIGMADVSTQLYPLTAIVLYIIQKKSTASLYCVA